MRALEPRVLLDAAAAETAFDLVDTVHASLADEWFAQRFAGNRETASTASLPETELEPDADAGVENRIEYVFFAGDIGDIGDTAALAAALPPHARVFVLDERSDGVEQMAEILDGAEGVSAIHIVSHGRAGTLSLGATELSAHSMLHRHADALARIGQSLAADGDLLIYGCDFASGTEGADAVERLARATGADVAASTNATGAAALGGDWQLEAREGLVETRAIDGGSALSGLLSDVVAESLWNTNDLASDTVRDDNPVTQTFTANTGGGDATLGSITLQLRLNDPASDTNSSLRVEILDGNTVVAFAVVGSAGFNDTSFVSRDIQLSPGAGGGVVSDGTRYTIRAIVVGGDDDWEVGLSKAPLAGEEYVDDDKPKTDKSLYFQLNGAVTNQAPVFDAPSGTEPIELPETRDRAIPIRVSDPDGSLSGLDVSVSGGADREFFYLSGSVSDGNVEIGFNQPIEAREPRDANGDGIYEIELAVRDEKGAQTVQTFFVRATDVDQRPTAPADGSATVTEDEIRPLRQELLGIVDPDGDPIVSFTLGMSDLQGGRLVHSGNVDVIPNQPLTLSEFRSLRYRPAADYAGENGEAWFEYQIETENPDGGRNSFTDAVRFTLDFREVNDAPTVGNFTVRPTEDVAFPFAEQMFPIDDVDGTATFVRIVALPERGGTLFWGENRVVEANTDVPIAWLDDLRFVPDENFDGETAFTYRVTDDDDAVSGEGIVRISMVPVDDRPVPTTAWVTTNEDEDVFIPASAFGYTDAEGDALTGIGLFGIDLTQGEFAPGIRGGEWGFWFTPAPDSSGTFTYGYVVENDLPGEGTGTLTIEVKPVNDRPTAAPSAVVLEENGSYTFAPSDFPVADADGDDLWVTLDTFDLGGGTLTRLDPVTGTAVPVLEGTRIALGDVDTLVYTPARGFSGFASFQFSADDGGSATVAPLGSEPVPMLIAVTDAPNAPPVALGAADATNDDGATISLDLSDAFSDTDALTYSATNLPPGLLIDPLTGIVSGTVGARASDVPVRNVTVTATDTDGQTATVSFDWVMVNPSPVALDDAFGSSEDEVLSGSVAGNDADPDRDGVEYVLVSQPDHGSIDFFGDGSFLFTPAPDETAPVSFTYAVIDMQGARAEAVALITLTPVDDAPEAADTSVSAEVDQPLALGETLLLFEDVDGDAFSDLRITRMPEEGRLVTGPGEGTPVAQGDVLDADAVASLRFVAEVDADTPSATSFEYVLRTSGGSTTAATVTVELPAFVPEQEPEPEPEPEPPVVDEGTRPSTPTVPPATSAEEGDEEPEAAEEEDVEAGEEEESGDDVAATQRPVLPEKPEGFVLQPKDVPAPAAPRSAPSGSPEPVLPSSRNPAAPAVERERVPEVSLPDPASSQPIAGYSFTPVDPVILAQTIERTGDEMRNHRELLTTTTAKVSFAFGSVLAVGSVSYLIQGGALAGALLSAMPAWRRYDPIQIVSGRAQEEDEEDDEPSAVEQMRAAVEAARARVKPLPTVEDVA